MSSLLLFALAAGCGDVTINVNDDDDTGTGSVPDTGDTGADTGDTGADTGADTGDSDDTGVWPGGGGWTAQAPARLLANRPDSMLLGIWAVDATEDGHDDVLAAYYDYSAAVPAFVAEILPGDGHGGFGSPLVSTSGAAPTPALLVSLGDADGDGHLDLAFPTADGFNLFFGSGHGFDHDATFPRGYAQSGLVDLVDLDGDGADEIMAWSTTATYHQAWEFLRWNGSGVDALTPYVEWTLDRGTLFCYGLIPYDEAGTGRESAVLAGPGTSMSQDYFVSATGSGASMTLSAFSRVDRYSDDGVIYGVGADLDGDGKDEVITGGKDGLQIFDPVPGLQATIARQDGQYDYGVWAVTGNLNGDTHPDVVEYLGEFVDTGNPAPTATISSSLGNGVDLDPASSLRTSLAGMQVYGRGIGLADFDEDNCGDLVVQNAYPEEVYLLAGRCGT
jgi:hypothetical protein